TSRERGRCAMTSPPEPPTPRRATGRRAAIIGVGLIGGSIGMGLRRAGWYVTGIDRNPDVARQALALGVLDAVGEDPGAALTVVATPVTAVPGAARDALTR